MHSYPSLCCEGVVVTHIYRSYVRLCSDLSHGKYCIETPYLAIHVTSVKIERRDSARRVSMLLQTYVVLTQQVSTTRCLPAIGFG